MGDISCQKNLFQHGCPSTHCHFLDRISLCAGAGSSTSCRAPPQPAAWTSAPWWSSPWAAGKYLLWHLEHLLPLLLLLLWRWCLQGCFSPSILHSYTVCAAFCPFLNTSAQKRHHVLLNKCSKISLFPKIAYNAGYWERTSHTVFKGNVMRYQMWKKLISKEAEHDGPPW